MAERTKDPIGPQPMEIDFSVAPQVNEFVRLAANCEEENYFQFRLKELSNQPWTVPQWNLLGAVTKVILQGRSNRKDAILELIGTKRAEAEESGTAD